MLLEQGERQECKLVARVNSFVLRAGMMSEDLNRPIRSKIEKWKGPMSKESKQDSNKALF